jgi:organic hydroperoxide reductase OsmC/OhrA
MSEYKIEISWKNKFEQLSYENFSRDHLIRFSGEQSLTNSSAPEYFGNKNASNPEELLASALASCHMLTFLAIASKSGYNIGSYDCLAIAKLDKNEEGKLSVTNIELKPCIEFRGDKFPSAEQLASMHEKAHRNCFIAQSLKTKVTIH